MNSPEDGPVGPKHVEILQYMNKIEIVTSVGFYSIYSKDARYKKLIISFDICTYSLNIQYLQLSSTYRRPFPLSENSESATLWQYGTHLVWFKVSLDIPM